MRTLTIGNTAVDLNAEKVPFLPGYTVVVLNATGSQLVLQEDDVVGFSGAATLATVPAGQAQNVTLDKQFIRVSTSAPLVLLGN